MKYWKFIFAFFISLVIETHAFAAKKILILYSRGGHSTAAKSIQTLLEPYPDEFEVISHNFGDELTGFSKWIYEHGYYFISKHANWINVLVSKMAWEAAEKKPLLCSESPIARLNQPEKILKYIRGVNPNVIIATHFSIAQTLAVLREAGHLRQIPIAWTHLELVNNTFYRQIGAQLDMSFLATEAMAQDWAELMGSRRVLATGIPIMPSFLQRSSEHKPNFAADWGIDPQAKTILLMGGSYGVMKYFSIIRDISKNFETANGSSHSKVQFIAICGRNQKVKDSLERWSKSSGFPKNASLRTTGFIDLKEMADLQIASDLIVSKPGGLSTFEVLTSGRPVLMVRGLGLNEQANATFLMEGGAALYVPNQRQIGKAAADLLFNTAVQETMIESQSRLRREFRLERIVDWVRNAQVVEPDAPPVRILEKVWERARELDRNPKSIAQAEQDTQSLLYPMPCENTF